MGKLREILQEVSSLSRHQEELTVRPRRITPRGLKIWEKQVRKKGFRKRAFAEDPQSYIDSLIPVLEKVYKKHAGFARGLVRMILDLDRMTLEAGFTEIQMNDEGYVMGYADYTIKLTLPIAASDLGDDIPIEIEAPPEEPGYVPPDDDYVWEVYVEPIVTDLKAALQRSKLL